MDSISNLKVETLIMKPSITHELIVEVMDEIIRLRKQVLHPEGPVERVIYKNDNLKDSVHFVVRLNSKLIGTGSVFPEDESESFSFNDWRIRGMAVDQNFRGQGLGQKIVSAIIEHVNSNSILKSKGQIIWCNARIEALSLYQRFGFIAEKGEFIIPGSGPHRRLRLTLNP